MNNKDLRGYIVANSKDQIEGLKRAFKLDNGTIITVKSKEKDYTLEYENNLFYEVKFKGYDQFMQSIYERTGEIFTPDEINNLTR